MSDLYLIPCTNPLCNAGSEPASTVDAIESRDCVDCAGSGSILIECDAATALQLGVA